MGRFSLRVATFLFVLVGMSGADGGQSAPSAAGAPTKVPPLPERPPAYLVVDADYGMILGRRDADKVWYLVWPRLVSAGLDC
jgi:D-alanyl-D-alanine carboxypeptidase